MTALTYGTFQLTRQYTKNPELCSLHCGDEFGLELNWNGTLNPVQTMILWRNWGGWHALNVFFFFASKDHFRIEYVAFTLMDLMRGNSKSDTESLKGFGSR